MFAISANRPIFWEMCWFISYRYVEDNQRMLQQMFDAYFSRKKTPRKWRFRERSIAAITVLLTRLPRCLFGRPYEPACFMPAPTRAHIACECTRQTWKMYYNRLKGSIGCYCDEYASVLSSSAVFNWLLSRSIHAALSISNAQKSCICSL